jgi:hypothetical protein
LLAVGELARGYLDGGVPGRWVPNVHEAVRRAARRRAPR